MAVDEAGDDGFPTEVDRLKSAEVIRRGDFPVGDVIVVEAGGAGLVLVCSERGVRLCGRSRPDHPTGVDEQSGVSDHVEFAETVEIIDDEFADPGE